MQIESIPTQDTVALTFETTLATLTGDAAGPIQSLYADLEQAGITPTAPLVFVYRDLDGDMNRPFTLEIAQPVDAGDLAGYKGQHQTGQLQPIQCAQRVHSGSLADMGERTYGPFFGDIAAAGLTPGRECREVYTQFKDVDSADNITHVQIQVQA